MVDLFIANEKFSQVVLGIDDDCVLVSKSVFMYANKSNGAAANNIQEDNFAYDSVIFENISAEP